MLYNTATQLRFLRGSASAVECDCFAQAACWPMRAHVTTMMTAALRQHAGTAHAKVRAGWLLLTFVEIRMAWGEGRHSPSPSQAVHAVGLSRLFVCQKMVGGVAVLPAGHAHLSSFAPVTCHRHSHSSIHSVNAPAPLLFTPCSLQGT
jgi:hypothetical protein